MVGHVCKERKHSTNIPVQKQQWQKKDTGKGILVDAVEEQVVWNDPKRTATARLVIFKFQLGMVSKVFRIQCNKRGRGPFPLCGDMRLIIWNVRGCNKPFKQKEIKILLQTNKVDVAVLLETRVKKEKAQKIVRKICKGWDHINNYNSAGNGRIWINWNPKRIQVRFIAEHEQALLCEIFHVQSGQTQVLLAVYALNTIEQRKQMWEFVVQQLSTADYPVLMGGDFNAILSVEDR